MGGITIPFSAMSGSGVKVTLLSPRLFFLCPPVLWKCVRNLSDAPGVAAESISSAAPISVERAPVEESAGNVFRIRTPFSACDIFVYSWNFPAYIWAFLRTIVLVSCFLFLAILAFDLQLALYDLQVQLFAYSGNMCDWAPQRTVSKKAPTVSKEAPTVRKKLLPPLISCAQPVFATNNPLVTASYQDSRQQHLFVKLSQFESESEPFCSSSCVVFLTSCVDPRAVSGMMIVFVEPWHCSCALLHDSQKHTSRTSTILAKSLTK